MPQAPVRLQAIQAKEPLSYLCLVYDLNGVHHFTPDCCPDISRLKEDCVYKGKGCGPSPRCIGLSICLYQGGVCMEKRRGREERELEGGREGEREEGGGYLD